MTTLIGLLAGAGAMVLLAIIRRLVRRAPSTDEFERVFDKYGRMR